MKASLQGLRDRMKSEIGEFETAYDQMRVEGWLLAIDVIIAGMVDDPRPVPEMEIRRGEVKTKEDGFTSAAVERADASGPRYVWCRGGPHDGDMVPIDQRMPCGAKTMIVGDVYELVDNGELRYLEPDGDGDE